MYLSETDFLIWYICLWHSGTHNSTHMYRLIWLDQLGRGKNISSEFTSWTYACTMDAQRARGGRICVRGVWWGRGRLHPRIVIIDEIQENILCCCESEIYSIVLFIWVFLFCDTVFICVVHWALYITLTMLKICPINMAWKLCL